MASVMHISVILALFTILIANSLTQVAENQCPSPDDESDMADAMGSNFMRPPAGILEFTVTGVGAYSLNVSWNASEFNFGGTDAQICHFYLNVSYLPSQKGSHHRTTHMNCDSTMNSAPIADLTPDTNVTIQLRTCLLMPADSNPRGFICTEPVKLVQQTAPNPDRCPLGSYNNTENICVPCQCNNKTKLCQTKTGECLDCLDGSDGEHCEKCVSGYVLNNNRCEAAPPGGHFNPLLATSTQPSSTAEGVNPICNNCNPGKEILSAATTPTTQSIQHSSSSISHTSPVTRTVPITIIVTSVLVAIAIISCVIILVYKKCGGCRKKPVQFWTIQLQSDNQPTVAYSDILDPQVSREDRNRLIENDFTGRLSEQQFMSDENPYRPVTT